MSNNDVLNNDSTDDLEGLEETHTKFSCPSCGTVSRDDVVFLCNTCDASELIHKDGMYICPSCLVPGENFECMLCGSIEVIMLAKSTANEE